MIIKEITAGTLKDYIHSPEYKASAVVPISKHRALSHIRNPRVSSNDVILLLAYVEGELAGYLGVLADQINLKGKEEKVGWISCTWVDEGSRGKGVMKKLLREAFRLWDNKILVTQTSPEAEGSFNRSGLFSDPFQKYGIRGYLRFNLHELLPPKNNKLKGLKPLLKITDGLLNIFNDIRLFYFKSFQKFKKHNIEYINEIDTETELLIKKYSKLSNISNRVGSDLDWIIKNPWVLAAPDSDTISKKYIFSSLDKHYSMMNIKLYDEVGKLKAFIIMSTKRKHLKIPYCYFHPDDLQEIINLVYNHMMKMNLNMLTVFHPLLKKYILNHKTPFIYKKEIKQAYFISKAFENRIDPSTIEFQDGDGDCAFT
jgi:hypothetical protein